MEKVLLSLGKFKFFIGKNAYSEIRRRISFEWNALQRISRRPQQMFVGVSTETISLSGESYQEAIGGDPTAIFDELKEMGIKGEAYVLVDSEGNNLGLWGISDVECTGMSLDESGVPRQLQFSLGLFFYE